jgi:hypothetical protein
MSEADSNYAEIGDLIVLRGDDESAAGFQERARAMALDTGADALIFGLLEPIVWPNDIESIMIEGGIAEDSSGDFAQFGETLLERADGETVEAFQIRSRDAARMAGAELVTFGGLRPMPTDDDDDPSWIKNKGE